MTFLAVRHPGPRLAARIGALLLVVALLPSCTTTADLALSAPPPLSEKYAAIVVDANTGQVMYSYDADEIRHPASLTKMMTIYMIFEALDAGLVTPATPIPVSANAASRPPTKIGFRTGETISVEEAILALVVKSANDVATAVAEYLGGTEGRFAQMMTAKARRMGMRNTVFRNASGLPDNAMVTTARDMAVLAMALRRDHPLAYRYFNHNAFVYRGERIEGHNDLLETLPGTDGIKTGYIRASGFNLATSVKRGKRAIVAVVLGGPTAKSRNEHMRRLVELFLPAASSS